MSEYNNQDNKQQELTAAERRKLQIEQQIEKHKQKIKELQNKERTQQRKERNKALILAGVALGNDEDIFRLAELSQEDRNIIRDFLINERFINQLLKVPSAVKQGKDLMAKISFKSLNGGH